MSCSDKPSPQVMEAIEAALCRWYEAFPERDFRSHLASPWLQDEGALNVPVSLFAGSKHTWWRPLVRGLTLDAPSDLAQLSQDERLENVQRLVQQHRPWDEDAGSALMNTRALRKVREVHIEGASLSPDQLEAILGAPMMRSVQSLDLSNNPLGDAGLERIARCENLPALRSLVMYSYDRSPTASGLNALLSSSVGRALVRLEIRGLPDPKGPLPSTSQLPQLKELALEELDPNCELLCKLSENSLPNLHSLHLAVRESDPQVIEALSQSPLFDQLTTLSLETPEPELWMEALCKSGVLFRLTEFRLRDGAMSASPASPNPARWLCADKPSALKRLALCSDYGKRTMEGLSFFDAPSLQGLTHLYLEHPKLGDEALRTLQGAGVLPALLHLAIEREPLGNPGVKALASAPLIRQLKTLNLTQVDCGDPGARHLAFSPAMQQLERLSLYGNQIKSKGTQALAQTPMPKLRYLTLHFNKIGKPGALALANSANFPSLQELSLSGAAVKPAERQALQKSPHLQKTSIGFWY